MNRVLLFLGAALAALAASAGARAQSIHWDPPGGSLGVGQMTTLQLVCEDCEPKEIPQPPKVPGLSLENAGQSSNMSFINGTYSHSIIYTFAAILSSRQGADIPAFQVDTNKGKMTVAAAHFTGGNATVGNSGQSLDSAAHSSLTTSPSQVWAGEVFGLNYAIQATRSYYPEFGHSVFDWSSDPVIAEDWSHPVPFDTTSNGEAQTGLSYRTRGFIRKAGSYQLNPVNQLVNLSVGVTGFGFFQQRQYQQFSVASTTPTVDVRPLPPAPAGFTGAVGEFTLKAKIVPEKAAVGEPVTWTVELKGTGNWPDIAGLPARTVSNDFQVIQPKAKRDLAEGKLFEATLTEDIVLVPTTAGTYPLADVHFVFFNPKSGNYETLTASGATVTITAPTAAANPGSPQSAATSPSAESHAAPTAPTLPSGIPKDPLPETGETAAPRPNWDVAALAAIPFALLIVFWLLLARSLAQRTDPARPLREARSRLGATLVSLRSLSDPSAMNPLLRSWQRDASLLWGVPSAAPLAGSIPDPAWTLLWAEADRALYGPQPGLPPDWTSRAEAALSEKKVPPFRSRQVFKRHNLFPFFALALALALSSQIRANEPGDAAAADYRRGDFAAAEKGWRSELGTPAASWAGRYDLSLALAQEDHWDEAAAHAAAAFVQQPGNEAVRWQFALACDKAGYVPTPLADFLTPGPLESLASLASPSLWQEIMVGGAALAAVALAIGLGLAFGRRRGGTGVRVLIGLLLGLALCTVASSVACFGSYGEAADPGAVLVWRNSTLRSIPTEADTSQKTTPLPAGSVGRINKTFLGWVRLAFANGQTGWVRKDEVVGFWK